VLQVALEGNHEGAMVLASRPPESASWPVGEWAWPNPSKPDEARFVLRDQKEEELWGCLEQSRV
jgi:hypothetical protein